MRPLVIKYRALLFDRGSASIDLPIEDAKESVMKKDIHPHYRQTTVTCACGETFTTGSTRENIRVEICSKCHPFYTGQRKFVDSEGRVQKFAKKYGLRI